MFHIFSHKIISTYTVLLPTLFFGIIVLFLSAIPHFSNAHEVYVLSGEKFDELVQEPTVPLMDIIEDHLGDTVLWGLLVGFLIVMVFMTSISRRLEDIIDPGIIKIKHYAPFIARATAGLGFLASAYYGGLFGPELPFADMFGAYALGARVIFGLIGTFVIFGFFTRTSALLALLFFVLAINQYGWYMFTYSNYFGEIVVLLLVGAHKFGLEHWFGFLKGRSIVFDAVTKHSGEYAFLFLRIAFGVSLIYASVYAKVLHNQLAIAVVNDFNLTSVFPFEAQFIVLGAAIIEIMFGLFFIFGIEVRFTAVALNIFLFLSLMYFGEAVWPHIILIGVPIAFFCYGYDKYSLEGYFFKTKNREPIF